LAWACFFCAYFYQVRKQSTKNKMNQQMDNLSRLINKYSNRYGEQDILVLDLKKEMTHLQLRRDRLTFSHQIAVQLDRTDKVKNHRT
jgi:hypothetical protein